ncbi:predicted protein [Naegleria gruberi]|uniref:Predicted protein n=1 Tax=Naegleria gruberi TaxID=5762 RepID=D2VHZ0_NAEGR|nr:uncharacterized protein NAEGRDRAFT_68494 [Naegleria gruberi]EFC43422.1 predicted protein [Naegleria gruberi]|eukprot:XP_002676166.1 predicted protein [Naegleria gruberi strain NEG-M]
MKPLSDQDLLLYFTKFKKEIKPRDHTYLFTSYANCFSGKEAVKTLTSLFNNLSMEDAIQLGNQMIERKLFIHVTHESSQLLNKRYEFYRFTNFRRCSKRLSIMNVTQFTSSLDASYQKVIQDEYNNKGRVGDIRILLDDVYLSSQNNNQTATGGAISTANAVTSNSAVLSRSSSFFSSACVQSFLNDDIALVNNQTNETDTSSPDQQQNASSISLFGKKISVPLKIRKNSQPSHQNSPPMSGSFDNPNLLKKSPRGNNSPFTGFSSELSPHHKSSSAEDLYGRKVRLNEYVDVNSLGVGSPLKSIATSSADDSSPLQDTPSPQNESSVVSSSPRRHGMIARTTSQDFELKRNLEDMDLDFDKFANIDEVLKHPKACAILTKFAFDEYAEESIYFWKDLKAYKKESRIDCKLDMAIKIFDTYVNPDGSLALNITKKQIVECRRKYLNADDDCFDDIQKEVKIILNDLLDRLRLGIQQQKTNQINMLNSKSSLIPSSTSNLKMSRSDESIAFVQ